MDLERYTYVDNNANTLMSEDTKREIVKWMNKGNPSALYADDIGTTELINKFKLKVAQVCEFDPAEYTVIITSGASESNNFILRAVTASYISCKKHQPHILISSIEHKSLIECAKELKRQNIIELSIAKPNKFGKITLNEIKPLLQSNTCLVCVMHSNNETGIINEVDIIGDYLARKSPSIPFYVDCVQTFGKFPVRPTMRKITAFCASFHKLRGPPGIGVFVGLTKFIGGYRLQAEICGAQNGGMRGGTENIPYIAGSLAAMKETFLGRDRKNKDLLALQLYTLRSLISKVPTSFFENWDENNMLQVTGHVNYKDTNGPPAVEMIVLGTSSIDPAERYKYIMPNTLMISFVKHKLSNTQHTDFNENFVEGGGDPYINARPICNFKMAQELKKAGVIVGLGSACNTGQTSYVLESMGVPKVVANGAIRISYGDNNSEDDARTVVREILFALKTLL